MEKNTEIYVFFLLAKDEPILRLIENLQKARRIADRRQKQTQNTQKHFLLSRNQEKTITLKLNLRNLSQKISLTLITQTSSRSPEQKSRTPKKIQGTFFIKPK